MEYTIKHMTHGILIFGATPLHVLIALSKVFKTQYKYKLMDLEISAHYEACMCFCSEASSEKWRKELKEQKGNHPETKIKTTPEQFLKWALKDKPEIPKSQNETCEENKKYSEDLLLKTKKSTAYTYLLLNKYIEISPLQGNGQPFVLAYTEKGFKDQLLNALRKYQLI